MKLEKKVPEITGSFYSMKGTFRKILKKIGFIIIVIWKEFRTSINKRATFPSLERFPYRFQLKISLPPNLNFEPLNPRTLELLLRNW